MVLVVEPDHLLRVAVLGEADEAHLGDGRAVGGLDRAVDRSRRSDARCSRTCLPVSSAPTTPTTLNVGPERRQVGRDVARAAEAELFALEVQHRHRRSGLSRSALP